MSENMFTPGPWRRSRHNFSNTIEGPSGKVRFEGDDGYCAVAHVQSCGSFGDDLVDRKNQEANIALVIAAPDMLAALKEAARFLDYFANDRTSFVGGGTPKSALDMVLAAIALAEGTAP